MSCLSVCKYFSTEDIVLSFNGGKDCTVLLHLLFAILNKTTISGASFKHPRLFYVRSQTVFPEVETFVQSTLAFYKYQHSNIDHINQNGVSEYDKPLASLIIYDGSIREGLAELKQASPNLKVVFIGTRFADPWTGKQHRSSFKFFNIILLQSSTFSLLRTLIP